MGNSLIFQTKFSGGYRDSISGAYPATVSNVNIKASNGRMCLTPSSGGYISYPHSNQYNIPSTGLTIRVIFYRNSSVAMNSDSEMLLCHGQYSVGGWYVGMTPSTFPRPERELYINIYTVAGSNRYQYFSDQIVSYNKWQDAVWRVNPDYSCNLFLQGIRQNFSLISGSIATPYQPSLPLIVSEYASVGAGYAFKGQTDLVEIYNRALSDIEIYNLYAATVNGYSLTNSNTPQSAINLVGMQWKMGGVR